MSVDDMPALPAPHLPAPLPSGEGGVVAPCAIAHWREGC